MWTIGDNKQHTCGGVTRQGFLQAGMLGAVGLSLPDFLQAQARTPGSAKSRSVILLWLWGGPSHLDTFDPKPNAPSEYRGPFQAIPTTVPGIQICEYLPMLAKQAKRFPSCDRFITRPTTTASPAPSG